MVNNRIKRFIQQKMHEGLLQSKAGKTAGWSRNVSYLKSGKLTKSVCRVYYKCSCQNLCTRDRNRKQRAFKKESQRLYAIDSTF